MMINMPGDTFTAVTSGTVAQGDLVSSAASTDVMTAITSAGYVESTVLVATATNAHDLIIVGIALTGSTTGNYISVATSGLFIVESGAAVTTGKFVAQETTAQKVETSTDALKNIGKALTGASAAAKYVLIKLNI